MADTKISALPGASTPLAGTEVLPIVQSGATVKATVENVLNSAQPSGVANGVTYLNGSKISTSNSNFVFNGTALSIGTSNTPGLLNTFGTATGTFQVGATFANGGLTAGSTSRVNFLTGEDGTVGRTRAIIEASTPASNDGSLAFYTRSAGGTAVRMLIGASDVTVNTGNLVIGTSGRGIDFSATPGTGTSELLADYEEGTWTPVDSSGAGLTLTNEATATYTKVGRQVTANFWVKYPVTASGAGATIGGLPFTSASGVSGSVIINQTEYTVPFTGAVQQGTAQTTFFTFGNTQLTNVNLSNLRVRATAIYFV